MCRKIFIKPPKSLDGLIVLVLAHSFVANGGLKDLKK